MYVEELIRQEEGRREAERKMRDDAFDRQLRDAREEALDALRKAQINGDTRAAAEILRFCKRTG